MKKLNIPKNEQLEKRTICLKKKTIVELNKIAKKEKVGLSVIIRSILEEYLN